MISLPWPAIRRASGVWWFLSGSGSTFLTAQRYRIQSQTFILENRFTKGPFPRYADPWLQQIVSANIVKGELAAKRPERGTDALLRGSSGNVTDVSNLKIPKREKQRTSASHPTTRPITLSKAGPSVVGYPRFLILSSGI